MNVKHFIYCVIASSAVLALLVSCADSDDDATGFPGYENDSASIDLDIDSDADGDADADSDGDSDGDTDDGYPPEQEEAPNYMSPQGAGRYVFIADETHDAVVIVDSDTLVIDVVEVGSRPTHLVPLSDDRGDVAIMNLDSDEVTLLSVDDSGKSVMIDLPVRPDTNAIVPSPDGRFIVAFHDPRFTAESGIPTTDQEISVIRTGAGDEVAVDMTVGMHPWRVLYDKKVTRAFIINEEGINIINLDELDNPGIPPIISPFEGGTYDSTTADIEITPDGSLILARETDSTDLVTARLDAEDVRTYTMEATPTDLDISPDGSFGVLALRALGQVALFDLPLPTDPEDDPFTYIELEDKVAGVATLTPDGDHILLHTTTAGDNEDKKRLTILSRDGGDWQVHSTVLERQIRALAVGVNSKTAVVVHQKISTGANQQPYSYSLISIPSLQAKFQQIPVEPGQLLLTPDGHYGYLLLEEAKRTDVINLQTFIVDSLVLGSPPTAAGYALETDKVFIAQDHPAGRMTFMGVHDSSVKTVTGYNLNDDIEY